MTDKTLMQHMDDCQHEACMLAGLIEAACNLDNENYRNCLVPVLEVALEKASNLNNALDIMNRPKPKPDCTGEGDGTILHGLEFSRSELASYGLGWMASQEAFAELLAAKNSNDEARIAKARRAFDNPEHRMVEAAQATK